MKGWWVASKGLRPLPRRRGSALAHGCGRSGRVVLPLAVHSTGLRVRAREHGLLRHEAAEDELGVGVGVGVGVRVGVG